MKNNLHFPAYYVQKNYCCAAVAMKGIIEHLTDEVVSQDRIFEISHKAEKHLRSYRDGEKYKVKNEGMGSLGIIAVAKEFELRTFIKERAEIRHLEYFIERKIPVLVNWQSEIPDPQGEKGHFSVVIGVGNKEQKILIADPDAAAKRKYEIGFKEFRDRWYDPYPCERGWMAAFWEEDRGIKVPRYFRGRQFN